ncbi:MAG: penicillin-binding protein 1C, partial [Desulfovibrionaceae bacterium]|nr:penicillin-binding protein 1C [Desulfovibrionaceae bacterium]
WPIPALDGRGADYSLTITDTDGQLLRVYLNHAQQWILPPETTPAVPLKLIAALTTFEDRQFFRHWGYSLPALVRAVGQNLSQGRIVSGGSTLTMQAARLTAPQARTLWAKAGELLTALKLELVASKTDILKLYLSQAPFGGNIRGLAAAGWKYFGKPAADLTWAESALLAVLPNAPGLITLDKTPGPLTAKRNHLLQLLVDNGLLPAADLATALDEPLPDGTRAFPQLAPHAADRLRQAGAANLVRTTLSLPLQSKVDALAAYHNHVLREAGIRNLAVVVAETATGKVRAYLGSQDFGGDTGQVDGVQAPRSTGSLLKPFLYALAIDRGLLTPDALLRDLPTNFGAYAPKNASQEYAGLVPLKEALIRSLNVPAVLTLESYGVADFWEFLHKAGLTHLVRSAKDYGLPLILGGAEASVWEIAGLYRTLGQNGRRSDLTLREDQPSRPGPALFSPGAAGQIQDILREVRRPGVQTWWHQLAGYTPLAWKTGTSFGQKDAWAAGVSPEWTVVVWAGNFTGEGNPGLTSVGGAAPLLFDVFNALPRHDGWFEHAASETEDLQLCADTGYQAGPDCPTTLTARVPVGTQVLLCPYHQTIYTTADGQWRVDSESWGREGGLKKAVLIYPPEVLQHLRQSGRVLPPVPPWKPGSSGQTAGLALLYPPEGAKLVLPIDLDGHRQALTLRAAQALAQEKVFWYLDGRYLGVTQGQHSQTVSGLSPGQHQLLLLDGRGNRLERRFETAD